MKCDIHQLNTILVFVSQIPESKNWAQLVRGWGVNNFPILSLQIPSMEVKFLKQFRTELLWLRQGSGVPLGFSPLPLPGGNLLAFLLYWFPNKIRKTIIYFVNSGKTIIYFASFPILSLRS